MDFWEARSDNQGKVELFNCTYYQQNPPRLKDTPKWDNLWWLNGHMIYPSILSNNAAANPNTPAFPQAPNNLPLLTPLKTRRLSEREFGMVAAKDFYQLTAVQKVERAALLAQLTFLNYFRSQQIGASVTLLDWTMVARANGATDEGGAAGMLGMSTQSAVTGSVQHDLLQTVNSFYDGEQDRVLLLQHKQTLECALIFEGTGDFKDWLANLNFAPTDFCGFGKTHKGFRAKLFRMVAGIDYRQSIARRLANCAGVAVAGHSLGGAQAELFAACANNPRGNDETGYMDHRLMAIPKGTPKKMRSWYSDHAPGNFLQNRGNKWCIDVDGRSMSIYRSKVITYPCEFPSAPWSDDQRWSMNADGFIVNKLSGMCIDGNVTESPVVQSACQFQSVDTLQRWQLTDEGFLQNKGNGKCINGDMKLDVCPFSDQVWEIKASGHVVSKRSGKCLDVEGNPGVADGTRLALWSCEDDDDTDQRWELLSNGQLRNKLSGKCAVEQIQPRKETRPILVLGPCDRPGTPAHPSSTWQQTSEGFIQNRATGRCLNVWGQPGLEDGSEIDVVRCDSEGILTPGRWAFDDQGFLINVGYVTHLLKRTALGTWDLGKQGKMEDTIYQCVTVSGGRVYEKKLLMEGSTLHLDFCKLSSDQKWEVTEAGFIRNVIGSQKCLSVVHREHSPDPVVPQLWIDNCLDISDPALFLEMKWSKTAQGELRNELSHDCMGWSDKVKSTTNHGLTKGEVRVTEMQCSDPDTFGLWDFGPNGTMTSRHNGQCLDLGGPSFAANPPLAVHTCEVGKESQQWEFLPDGFLRNKLKQMCAGNFIDAANPSLRILILKDCPTGDSQKWDLLPSGQIRHKVSGYCLDAPHDTQAAEPYQLTLWTCDPARAMQQWDKIPTPMVEVA